MRVDVKEQISGLVKSAAPGFVWALTTEERRVEKFILKEMGKSSPIDIVRWSVTRGIETYDKNASKFEKSGDINTDTGRRMSIYNSPVDVLDWCSSRETKTVAVVRDLASWLNDPMTIRALKDTMEDNKKTCIVALDQVKPPSQVPGIVVYDWPAPDRTELSRALTTASRGAPERAKNMLRRKGQRDKVISSLSGLTLREASTALRRSLSTKRVFDPSTLLQEKQMLIRGSGLEWYEPEAAGMDAVGGLDALKQYLKERRMAFSGDAMKYGIPAPKGIMLLGVQGCGKSLVAKCVAETWQLPLLRLDVGSLFSKWLGESERQMNAALSMIDSVAPCILWLDEIEKAFSQGGGETDGGTSKRLFGSFLTWMQEHKAGVYMLGTSNDISQLPAEFCRAGRWDDIWFVDLPNREERVEIAKVMQRKYPKCAKTSAEKIADISENYTGAELESAFVDSLFPAFMDSKRAVRTDDILEALKKRVPLAIMMREKVSLLRNWAQGRARRATTPTVDRQDSESTDSQG
jgi:SpoVK/Ycf46/Vps4 family AAA+-type ATPase